MIFSFNFISSVYDLGFIEKGECVDLYQSCSNCSYVNITSMKYPNDTIVYHNFGMDKNGRDYTYNFCATDLDGDYFYTTCGDQDGVEECRTFDFYVNEGGVEITDGRSSLTIALLFVLVCFLFISLFFMVKSESYKSKFALYWLSHVLFILVNFIGWQIGVEGILGSVALTGIFRIFFYIGVVAVVPMIFLSLTWIFYIHTFNEHFQKLIDKGNDPEVAFKLSKRKSGGWFNGK